MKKEGEEHKKTWLEAPVSTLAVEEATPQPTFMNVALYNHTALCLPLHAGKQLYKAKDTFNVVLL